MKKQKLHMREFLNSRNGMAAVEARVYVERPYHVLTGAYQSGVSATLSLSDCGQTISIDFECDATEKRVKERLAKLDRIRKALDVIEEGLIEGYLNGATEAECSAVLKARKLSGQETPHYVSDD